MSKECIHFFGPLCIHTVYGKCSLQATQSCWNPNPSTMETEGDRPTACVIAQQYSSATFIHCTSIPAGRYSARLKNVIYFFFNFIIKFCVSLKLRNLKLLKSRIFCSRRQNQMDKRKLIFAAVKALKFSLGHTKPSVVYMLRALKTNSGNTARSRPRQNNRHSTDHTPRPT